MAPLMEKLIREKAIAADNLTREQLADAILQAIAAGDFCRYVDVDHTRQTVTYIPFREVESLKSEIARLKEEISELHWRLYPEQR